MRKLVPWFGAVVLALMGCSTGSDAEGTVTNSSASTKTATLEVGSTQPTSPAVPPTTTLASFAQTPNLAVLIAGVSRGRSG